MFGKFTWVFPVSTMILFLGYPQFKPIFISFIICFFYYIKNNLTDKKVNIKSYLYFFFVTLISSYIFSVVLYLPNFFGFMLVMEYT